MNLFCPKNKQKLFLKPKNLVLPEKNTKNLNYTSFPYLYEGGIRVHCDCVKVINFTNTNFQSIIKLIYFPPIIIKLINFPPIIIKLINFPVNLEISR